jgi:hypothetical protein
MAGRHLPDFLADQLPSEGETWLCSKGSGQLYIVGWREILKFLDFRNVIYEASFPLE